MSDDIDPSPGISNTLGTHPDIIPILATILLRDHLNHTLVNLASTCRENWLNTGTIVEKGKLPYKRPKKSGTLLGEYTSAQFLLMR